MAFYVTLKCDKTINPLDKEYRLRGEWEVAIVQTIIGNKPIDSPVVWILCDLVEYSNYNSIPMPLLGIINSREGQRVVNTKPYYTRIVRKRFSSINIVFKADPESESDLILQDLYLRLHFRKH